MVYIQYQEFVVSIKLKNLARISILILKYDQAKVSGCQYPTKA